VADVLPTDEAVAQIRAIGRRALGLPCDVTSSADIATLIEQTLGEFGRIDILVNNAGVLHRSGLEDTTEDIWGRDIDVIMTGTYRMTQSVFSIMKHQGDGKIVNIPSVSGKIGGAVSKPTDTAETLLGRSPCLCGAADRGKRKRSRLERVRA
jgi:NAD(P)-dependent dehydrogenase (short-subunit alcohol dehydrogenase family)